MRVLSVGWALDGESGRVASDGGERARAASVVAKATDAWRRQVEKTYGALVQEIGRSAAEGYFPRPRTTAKASAPTPTPTS
jgi:hypothetical protein